MAQRAHVPRFGDWTQNGQNAAYTMCFDTARKGKVGGTNVVNPNDPEQMPELHKPRPLAPEHQHPKQGHWEKPMEHNVVNQQQKASYGREERGTEGHAQPPQQPRHGNWRASMDQDGRKRTGAGTRRNSSEAAYGPSASPVTQGRAANSRQGDAPGRQRPMTVPKFGEWDAADPNSSAGYTVIFSQVKEEKKAAATHLPPAFVQPTPPPAIERECHQDSFWTGLFPCLRPSVRH